MNAIMEQQGRPAYFMATDDLNMPDTDRALSGYINVDRNSYLR
jgi:hypothetical protein